MNRTDAQSPIPVAYVPVVEDEVLYDAHTVKFNTFIGALALTELQRVPLVVERPKSPTDKKVEEASGSAFKRDTFTTPPRQHKDSVCPGAPKKQRSHVRATITFHGSESDD